MSRWKRHPQFRLPKVPLLGTIILLNSEFTHSQLGMQTRVLLQPHRPPPFPASPLPTYWGKALTLPPPGNHNLNQPQCVSFKKRERNETWVFVMKIIHIRDKAVVRQEEPDSRKKHRKVNPMVAVLRFWVFASCSPEKERGRRGHSQNPEP